MAKPILDFALKRLASMAGPAEGLYMYHAKAHRQTNSYDFLPRSYFIQLGFTLIFFWRSAMHGSIHINCQGLCRSTYIFDNFIWQ